MRSSLLSAVLLSTATALYIEPNQELIGAPIANIRVDASGQQTPRTVPPVTKGTLTNAPRADRSKSIAETTWNPPKYLIADLDAIRGKTTQTYGQRLFKGTGFHQVLSNKGYINYCVRWDSTSVATSEQRAQVNASIQKQYKKWMDVMKGFMGWPYDEVKVNIIGWAAKNASLLPGPSDGYKIFTDKDAQGVPVCDMKCSRARRPSNYATSCPDGKGKHYDNELWLKDGLKGGKGNFNFQQVGKEYYLGEMAKGKDDIHIYLHEVVRFPDSFLFSWRCEWSANEPDLGTHIRSYGLLYLAPTYSEELPNVGRKCRVDHRV
jgi:hypothetical protein